MIRRDQDKALGEKKVVRRALLTGLAAAGAAAALKATGAEKAEATDGQFLLIGDEVQTAESETRLNATIAAGPALQVLLNGASVSTFNAAIRGANAVFGGTGVYGQGGFGVYGFTGTGTGTFGYASGSGGRGAIGMSGADGTGVLGVSNTGGGNTVTANGSGFGVQGRSSSGAGVRGESVNGAGVSGVSVNQPGVDGVSTGSLGIRGTSTNFVGIVGISTNSHGLYGSSSSGAAGYGIVAENLGANGPGLLVSGSAPSQIYGGLQVFGVKNAIIRMQDGTLASVYCQESPEPYFEDFGRAQLAGGIANVPLERQFATLVAGGDYMVFCFPQGDTRGLYVSRQDANGFAVREVQGGTGNVPFTYRIVTKRKDIEGKRFARVSDEGLRNLAAVRAQAGVASPQPGGPQPGNVPPYPGNAPTQPGNAPTQPGNPPSSSSPPTPVTGAVSPGLTVVQPAQASAAQGQGAAPVGPGQ